MDFIVETKKTERPDIIKGLNKLIDSKQTRKDFAIPLEIARLQKEIELLMKEQVNLDEELGDLKRLIHRCANTGENGKIKNPETK